jgi:hypothetical protein
LSIPIVLACLEKLNYAGNIEQPCMRNYIIKTFFHALYIAEVENNNYMLEPYKMGMGFEPLMHSLLVKCFFNMPTAHLAIHSTSSP